MDGWREGEMVLDGNGRRTLPMDCDASLATLGVLGQGRESLEGGWDENVQREEKGGMVNRGAERNE